MQNEIILLIVGGAIGLFSSIFGIIISHFLSLSMEKKKYQLEIQMISDRIRIEKEIKEQDEKKAIQKLIANSHQKKMSPTVVSREARADFESNLFDDYYNSEDIGPIPVFPIPIGLERCNNGHYKVILEECPDSSSLQENEAFIAQSVDALVSEAEHKEKKE